MTVKLIALDLDGTTFADDLVISDRMRRAIAASQQKGVIVTLATGRMFRSARQFASDLAIAEPLICYQGAFIAHSVTGDVLYHKTIPLEDTRAIIEETGRLGLHLNVYVNDELFVDRITPEARYYSRVNMDMEIHEVGDLDRWITSQVGAEPTKLVIVTDPDKTDPTLAHFTEWYSHRLQVTKSHPRFTEFTNRECSKGRALSFLAEYCGVAREEVMAIGDGHNDLDMIAWAGYGIAMATSPRPVLDAAWFVTGTLAEAGAASAIEKYVLGE
jgi:Cof subfamily protein (haloacid dehalogenase superfamily)